MSVPTFLKQYNLDIDDSVQIFKRINRVTEGFYNQELNIVNMVNLLEPLDMLLSLESRYSLLTTIQTIRFIIKLYEYYEPSSKSLDSYKDIENDLMSIYENPKSYIKITKCEIEEFIEIKVSEFMKKTTCYTKVRNLLLIALMSQYHIKLNELVNIKYICYDGADFSETFPNKVAILKRDCEFYFIRNGSTILEQTIEHITYLPLHKLLSFYLAKFRRGEYLLSGIKGSQLSKSNISNGLINFTRSELGYPISIFDLRLLHSIS